MDRRSLLVGAAASSVGLAGCLSTDATVVQESTTVEEPDDPDEPVARATVGFPSPGDPPHRVRLWNRTDERRSIGLEISSHGAAFAGTYDLEDEAHVVVTLRERDEYTVTVTVDETTVESSTLEADSFDEPCPATELFVLEDGEFELMRESEADHCDD